MQYDYMRESKHKTSSPRTNRPCGTLTHKTRTGAVLVSRNYSRTAVQSYSRIVSTVYLVVYYLTCLCTDVHTQHVLLQLYT